MTHNGRFSVLGLAKKEFLSPHFTDLTTGDPKHVITNPDDKGQAELSADTDGEAIKVRIDGQYLTQALKACVGFDDIEQDM